MYLEIPRHNEHQFLHRLNNKSQCASAKCTSDSTTARSVSVPLCKITETSWGKDTCLSCSMEQPAQLLKRLDLAVRLTLQLELDLDGGVWGVNVERMSRAGTWSPFASLLWSKLSGGPELFTCQLIRCGFAMTY